MTNDDITHLAKARIDAGLLPYVDDHGPEIIARDHAPDLDRIDSALAASGATASDRWAARMNAHKATSTFTGPTQVSAAASDTVFDRYATPTEAYDALRRQTGQLPPTQDQLSASMARHPSNVVGRQPGISR